MVALALITLATLAANGARQLRVAAVAFLIVAVASIWIASGNASYGQIVVSLCAAFVAAALLFIAAGDARYGEDAGWRLSAATAIAAAATPAAFAAFRTAVGDTPQPPLFGVDTAGVTIQVAAFWLLSSGIAILLTARGAMRVTLGALLMITGVQLLIRLVSGPQLSLTLLFAWLEVVVALVGSFLIVNERGRERA